jgi:hypothetical protein
MISSLRLISLLRDDLVALALVLGLTLGRKDRDNPVGRGRRK